MLRDQEKVKVAVATKEDDTVKRVFLAVIFGLLAATSNSWLYSSQSHSNYDAPWVYPAR